MEDADENAAVIRTFFLTSMFSLKVFCSPSSK